MGPEPERKAPVLPAGALYHFLPEEKKREIDKALEPLEKMIKQGLHPVALYSTLMAHYYGLMDEDEKIIQDTIERLSKVEPQHAIALQAYVTMRRFLSGEKRFEALRKEIKNLDPNEILRAEEIIHNEFGVRPNILSIIATKPLGKEIKKAVQDQEHVEVPVLTSGYTKEIWDKIRSTLDIPSLDKEKELWENIDKGAGYIGSSLILLSFAYYGILRSDLPKFFATVILGSTPSIGAGLLARQKKHELIEKSDVRFEREYLDPRLLKNMILHPHDLYAVDKNPHLRRKFEPFSKIEKELMKVLPEPPKVQVRLKR